MGCATECQTTRARAAWTRSVTRRPRASPCHAAQCARRRGPTGPRRCTFEDVSPFVRSSPHPDRSASEREAPQDARDHAGTTRPDATARADDDRCLTVADVAARLKPDPDTVRRGPRLPASRLLDLREAESYSGISAWTLRELIATGALPAVRPPHLRRVWIDRADLDQAIAKWKDRSG